jgi:hypothetical protein
MDQRKGYKGEIAADHISVIVRLIRKPLDHAPSLLESALQRGEKSESDLDGGKEKSAAAP